MYEDTPTPSTENGEAGTIEEGEKCPESPPHPLSDFFRAGAAFTACKQYPKHIR